MRWPPTGQRKTGAGHVLPKTSIDVSILLTSTSRRGRNWKRANPSRFRFTVTSSSTPDAIDRKSTRLNSSHSQISYAVFCLKKKKKKKKNKIIETKNKMNKSENNER